MRPRLSQLAQTGATDKQAAVWDNASGLWLPKSVVNSLNGLTGDQKAYTTVDDEGTALTQRPTINFVGAGVTATDDAANNKTIVTIPGGGGGSSATLAAPLIGDRCVAAATTITLSSQLYAKWILVPFAVTISKARVYFAAAAGHVTASLYDNTGAQIATSGSVAVTGTPANVDLTLTGSLSLAAGCYILAFGLDTTAKAGCSMARSADAGLGGVLVSNTYPPPNPIGSLTMNEQTSGLFPAVMLW
ncbi:MAG TPA: hypothetical protein VG899_12460 [Mycobacteriales bacterium]|nr:hypothetical protein [Mycobacteriales bacterium]